MDSDHEPNSLRSTPVIGSGSRERPGSPEAILSSSAFPSLENLPTGQHYTPVEPFWFYRAAGSPQYPPTPSDRPDPDPVGSATQAATAWQPFTAYDSSRIEARYTIYEKNPTRARSLVHTDGGRFDVDLSTMRRKPVYWTDSNGTFCQVHRCTWFYINSTDESYVPYEPEIAEKLEEEYRKGMASDQWNRRIELTASKDFFIMYDANHVVHTKPALKRDEWGSVFDGKVTSHIVKRGAEGYKRIQEGTPVPIDHVIFVIHGIGEFCDFKFRTITQCVDGMRDISDKLLKSHFKESIDKGLIGRVEMIPCNWHKILHSESTGVDSRLQSITLSTIRKLREYTNDTLVDILFYTSPIYCQTIIDTVSNELNRLYALFTERNPCYKGTFSVIGHSLGSLIAFDLLSHQNDSDELEKRNAIENNYVVEYQDDNNTSDTLSVRNPTCDMDDRSSTISSRTCDSADEKASFMVGDEGRDSSSDGNPRLRPVKRLTKTSNRLVVKPKGIATSLLREKMARDPENSGAMFRSRGQGEQRLSQLFASLNLPPECQNVLLEQHMDMHSLLLCDEKDLKDLGITLGPRKKIMKYLTANPGYKKGKTGSAKGKRPNPNSSSMTDLTSILPTRDQRPNAKGATKGPGSPPSSRRRSLVTLDEMTNQEEAPTSTFGFTVGTAGTGQPYVSYQRLRFEPTCFFALGSPIGLFLTIRGIELIGDDYTLPTCPHFFNIFHPLDPVAFRIEPLVKPCLKLPPVQIPHHKGRKRIHLELQENLNKMSFDLRQGLFQTFKSTMNSLHGISFSKPIDPAITQQNPYLRGGLDASKSAAQIGGANQRVEQPENGLEKPPSLLSRMLRSASIQYSTKLDALKGDLWQPGGVVLDPRATKAKPTSSRPSLQISDLGLLNDSVVLSSNGGTRPTLTEQASETLSTCSNYQSASESGSSSTSLDGAPVPVPVLGTTNLQRLNSASSLYSGNPAQEFSNIERYIQTVSENAARMNKNITFSTFSTPISPSNADNFNETRNVPSSQPSATANLSMGRLNSGYRIDYILQEKPIEAFNEYIFALHSHVCYWESEDTILLILNQLYALQGITGSMHSSLLEEFASFMPSLFVRKV